jgi:hypothetical protein
MRSWKCKSCNSICIYLLLSGRYVTFTWPEGCLGAVEVPSNGERPSVLKWITGTVKVQTENAKVQTGRYEH